MKRQRDGCRGEVLCAREGSGTPAWLLLIWAHASEPFRRHPCSARPSPLAVLFLRAPFFLGGIAIYSLVPYDCIWQSGSRVSSSTISCRSASSWNYDSSVARVSVPQRFLARWQKPEGALILSDGRTQSSVVIACIRVILRKSSDADTICMHIWL